MRLRSLQALTMTLLASTSIAASDSRAPERPDLRDLTRPPRLAVFRAAGFPTADAPTVSDATLAEATSGMPVTTFDSAEALSEGLQLRRVDVLLLPYGSAFPLEAWPAIRGFVRSGGGLVVLGGAPFAQPVRRLPPDAQGARAYVLGARQPSFAHDLLLGPADAVEKSEVRGPVRVAVAEAADWEGTLPEPTRTYALTVRLATRKDLPAEGGSEGPRDAVLRPLVHVLDGEGIPRACPLLQIDRLRGDDAGGRWVLAPAEVALDAATIRRMLE